MGTGYTRQSAGAIVDEATIEASDLNAEFNQLESAFHSSTGHSHDGTTGEGPKINLVSGITGTLSVANGGTGATSLTDGGILLGSGTDAITAMGVLSNGQIVIGGGTTDPTTLSAFTSSTGTLKHEYGGLEADVSAFDGLLKISGGSTSAVTAPSGIVVGTTDSQTLTNKTINLGSNTISGTFAQFNSAVSDATFASTSTSQTLTNKTISLGNNTISGTFAQFNSAVSDATLASTSTSQTLTNKTINLGNNTISGTKAQFNSAVSDDTGFAYINTANTFTKNQNISGSLTTTGDILSDGNQGTNQSTISQSSVSFTGIPSSVKEIIIMLSYVAVSNDSDDILIRLGTSSGYVTSGYDSLSEFVSSGHSGESSTSGFIIKCNTGAAGQIHRATGIMSIVHRSSNAWVASFTGQIGLVGLPTSGYMVTSSGHISLGGTLDRVRLLPRVGSTFGSSSGNVNIIYR